MIIGIDLGTTNSLAAYYGEDGPKIIPNRLGKHLTPSVVSMDEEGQIYVGETARERELLYPGSAASVFKRSMGSAKKFDLGKKQFTAEELSSFVLRSLKEGRVTIFSTHIMDLALDLCDEIVLLSHGELEVVEKSNLDSQEFKEKIIAALKEETYA